MGARGKGVKERGLWRLISALSRTGLGGGGQCEKLIVCSFFFFLFLFFFLILFCGRETAACDSQSSIWKGVLLLPRLLFVGVFWGDGVGSGVGRSGGRRDNEWITFPRVDLNLDVSVHHESSLGAL